MNATTRIPAFLADGGRSSAVVGYLIPQAELAGLIPIVLSAIFDATPAQFEGVAPLGDQLLLVRQTGFETEYAVVNGEGVGHERQANGNTILVSCTHGWGGLVEVPVGIPVLLRRARVEDKGAGVVPLEGARPVKLADHIRSFGARLENNFSLWHNWATDQH